MVVMSNVWKVHNFIVKANAPKTEYEKLKRKINRTTLGYGAVLTSTYFITQGADHGVSATLGVATSLAYISLLENHVDNIEKSLFQKQLLPPVCTAVFESMWNHAPLVLILIMAQLLLDSWRIKLPSSQLYMKKLQR